MDELKNKIAQNLPALAVSKSLIACSGGVDSVVLTYLMKQLNFDIALAHCNFSLRGKESDDDENFVIELARNLEIPLFVETFDTKKYAAEHKISTQMAARELRYQWFAQILKDFHYDYLLTAHHLDDDLETFFINLSRGTGLKGLTGIPREKGNIIRPLLDFSRKDILHFAEENNLKWREDSSNKKPDYLRNKIRIEVLPKFKKTNDSILKNFQKTKRNLLASQCLIEDYMAFVYRHVVTERKDSYQIAIPKIQELPNTETLLFELLNGFGFTQWTDVSNLLYAQTGKQVISKTHQLLKDRNHLILTRIVTEDQPEEVLVTKDGITDPITINIKPVEFMDDVGENWIYVSGDKLDFPLKLRKWWQGDSFQPFGMKGKKKLSKFFKDEKIPMTEKHAIWLLLSDKKIVWIIGHRMDDRFKITKSTKQILRIDYIPNAQTEI